MTRLDPSLTPVERRTTLERVRSELTTGWQTADNSREKLTIADEREHVLFFLVEVVYDVIPAFYEGIEEALVAGLSATRPATRPVPEMLHFGSWVGGDMDGLPDVHAKTIRESCARHHALIVNRYFLEAQRLAEKLSQSDRRTPGIPQAMYDRIEHYKSVVPAARASTPSGHDEMPYRVLLGQIAERLRATYDHRSGQYERVEQLIDDLKIIARSLEANRGRYAGPVPASVASCAACELSGCTWRRSTCGRTPRCTGRSWAAPSTSRAGTRARPPSAPSACAKRWRVTNRRRRSWRPRASARSGCSRRWSIAATGTARRPSART